MTFDTLGVKEDIVRALHDIDIVKPTTIQEKTIPLVIEGKDVVGMSRTGSGKTAAFGIPALHNMDPGNGVQIMVMAPTRELAVQISDEMQKFGKYLNFKTATVFGGVAIEPQMRKLETADVVVATPGRLLDHLERGTIDLSRLRCVILDEADKMVEMGFIEDVTKILEATPEYRQVLLFGATISTEIEHLKERFMRNPATAEAETHVEEDLLEQYYYDIPQHEKFSLLVHLLKNEEVKQGIIFCSARSTVDLVAKNLEKQGIRADLIHGKMSQNKRLKMIKLFNEGKSQLLVASAVAARGLHIDGVSHVFNYDLSKDPQEYIHKIGRTARAGESGKAITLLSERDYGTFQEILNRYPVNVERLEKGEFQKLRFETRPQRGRFGDRNRNRYQQARSYPRRKSWRRD